jgi:hypothetical protein
MHLIFDPYSPAIFPRLINLARRKRKIFEIGDFWGVLGHPPPLYPLPAVRQRVAVQRMSPHTPSPRTAGDWRLSEAKSRLVGSWGEGLSLLLYFPLLYSLAQRGLRAANKF